MEVEKKYKDIATIKRRSEPSERLMLPFSQLNWLINGVIFGSVLLLTSFTNAGKSTLATMFIESAIKQGYNCFGLWGEDSEEEAQERIFKQHTPYSKDNMEYISYYQNGKKTNTGEFILSEDKFNEARDFFRNSLFIWDNEIPPNKDNIIDILENARVKDNCRVFLLDNLEILDFDTDNENKGIKEIMVAIRRWAMTNKTIIILVAHIRKIERDIIRPDIFDVKGTNSVTNVCRNIITIIRTDNLDKNSKGYKNFSKVLQLNGYDIQELDAVLEVRKDKGNSLGFCGLKYNKYTNSYYEIELKKNVDNTKNKTVLSIKDNDVQTTTSFNNMTPIEDDGSLPF